VTTFYDIFVGSFIMTLQLLTIIAAVLACASVGAIGFFGVSFLRGVYLAATGKPMPPKPEQS
jgi:hypothetical protein